MHSMQLRSPVMVYWKKILVANGRGNMNICFVLVMIQYDSQNIVSYDTLLLNIMTYVSRFIARLRPLREV